MKLAILSAAFLFATYVLDAQTPAHTDFLRHVSSGCPVSMRLNQAVRSESRLIGGDGQSHLGFQTSLRLVLSRANVGKVFPSSIKSAEVTVHGYNEKPQFGQVSPGNAPIAQRL